MERKLRPTQALPFGIRNKETGEVVTRNPSIWSAKSQLRMMDGNSTVGQTEGQQHEIVIGESGQWVRLEDAAIYKS